MIWLDLFLSDISVSKKLSLSLLKKHHRCGISELIVYQEHRKCHHYPLRNTLHFSVVNYSDFLAVGSDLCNRRCHILCGYSNCSVCRIISIIVNIFGSVSFYGARFAFCDSEAVACQGVSFWFHLFCGRNLCKLNFLIVVGVVLRCLILSCLMFVFDASFSTRGLINVRSTI